MLHNPWPWRHSNHTFNDPENPLRKGDLPAVCFRQPKWNDSARRFLSTVTGSAPEDIKQPTPTQQTYLNYIYDRASIVATSDFADILNQRNRKSEDVSSDEQIFGLLSVIADVAKVETQLSIDKIIEVLSSKGTFKEPKLSNALHHNKARCTVFFLIGHIFLLYPALTPRISQACDSLIIESGHAACMEEIQPTENSCVSIGEIMRTYGLSLPILMSDSHSYDYPFMNISKDLLYVSLLNASTLTTVGGISIIWVNNISSHLTFDPEKQELMIFFLPSFCDIIKSKETPLARIVNAYYDEYDKPSRLTITAMLKEIRLSYHLLFRDSPRSQKVYKGLMRQIEKQSLSVDPYLTMLCQGKTTQRGGSGYAYSKSSEFPIFSERLSSLQDFMLRRNPDSLRSIWYDTRDVFKWYTFWAVVILGGIGLVLSVLQVGLAIAQVTAQVTTSN